MTDPAEDTSALEDWLTEVSGPQWVWYIKYLSANDTYAKRNVHAGGPYLGRDIVAGAFPQLTKRADRDANPDLFLFARLDSHGWSGDVRLVWYNSKRLTGKSNGRDEARLTRWGGRDHPIVEPDATGSLTVFAFRLRRPEDADGLRVWRCRSVAEEDLLGERFGDLDPGHPTLISPTGAEHPEPPTGSCALDESELPPRWREAFPTGEQILDWVIERRSDRDLSVDDRLMRRRECEYEVFRSVERYHVLPRVQQGFETVDSFIEFAGSVGNRRKSRAGRSLELHVRRILIEENIPHSWQARTEANRTPDFIFPSIERYHAGTGPDESLRMLAAKTTCKDRWRQILNEAARIPIKHLITLQRGVSVHQHQEMAEEGVVLVVPRRLASFYPEEVRDQLLSLQHFLHRMAQTSPAST